MIAGLPASVSDRLPGGIVPPSAPHVDGGRTKLRGDEPDRARRTDAMGADSSPVVDACDRLAAFTSVNHLYPFYPQRGNPALMTGRLSGDDWKRIRQFAETPTYDREPEMLIPGDDDDEGSE